MNTLFVRLTFRHNYFTLLTQLISIFYFFYNSYILQVIAFYRFIAILLSSNTIKRKLCLFYLRLTTTHFLVHQCGLFQLSLPWDLSLLSWLAWSFTPLIGYVVHDVFIINLKCSNKNSMWQNATMLSLTLFGTFAPVFRRHILKWVRNTNQTNYCHWCSNGQTFSFSVERQISIKSTNPCLLLLTCYNLQWFNMISVKCVITFHNNNSAILLCWPTVEWTITNLLHSHHHLMHSSHFL